MSNTLKSRRSPVSARILLKACDWDFPRLPTASKGAEGLAEDKPIKATCPRIRKLGNKLSRKPPSCAGASSRG